MHKLRERIPGVAIRTTFITGFPGETEQDHEMLMQLIEDIGFDAMGVFEYSNEPGTPAGTMENDPKLAVPAEVKARRKHELMTLQQELAFEQAEYVAQQWDPKQPAESGVHLDVLIDKPLASATLGVSGIESTTSDRDAAASGAGTLHQGRAYFQAPDVDSVTYVQSAKPLAVGELVRCAVVASDGYDLIARPVDELAKRVSLKIL
jgi:ribosomal protein S12 methylthiotransferase